MSAFGIEVDASSVCLFNEPVSKHEALTQLAQAVAAAHDIDDSETLIKAIFEREAVMSTGIGSGVAIPHVRVDVVRMPSVGVGISRVGIDYDTLDNEPVYIIILFAMPSGSQKEYLGLLAQVMITMKTPGFTKQLQACSTPEEVAALLNE